MKEILTELITPLLTIGTFGVVVFNAFRLGQVKGDFGARIKNTEKSVARAHVRIDSWTCPASSKES